MTQIIKIAPNTCLVREDMDVNEHERQSNITPLILTRQGMTVILLFFLTKLLRLH